MTSTGSDLPGWLHGHGPLAIDQTVLFTTGLADQLSALHAVGMVHGSLAPTTVRVESVDGRIRPARFDRQLYQQVGGPTPADDVAALGVVLSLLLDEDSGRDDAAPPGSSMRPTLRALASQCLAPDPADRPTAAVVGQRLRAVSRDLLLGLPAGLPDPAVTASHPPAAPGLHHQVPGPTDRTGMPSSGGPDPAVVVPGYVPSGGRAGQPPQPKRWRRRTLVAWASGAALVLAVAAGAVVLVGRHPAQPEHTSSATTAAPESGPDTTSPRPSPTGAPYLVQGSETGLNEASKHGCRAWMNGRNPGPYAQAVIESSGDDCETALWRSRNGGRVFAVVSGAHRIRAGSEATNFYWDGDSYLARVCLVNHTTGQSGCGNAFGGPGMAAGG